MKLITKELMKKLEKGYEREEAGCYAIPVLKLFNPCGSQTWIISSISPEGIMFGLCDMGMGMPEMGYVSLQELEAFKGPMGIGIERDKYWSPKEGEKLKDYAEVANQKGYIVDYL